jgi:hypothetical protein
MLIPTKLEVSSSQVRIFVQPVTRTFCVLHLLQLLSSSCICSQSLICAVLQQCIRPATEHSVTNACFAPAAPAHPLLLPAAIARSTP